MGEIVSDSPEARLEHWVISGPTRAWGSFCTSLEMETPAAKLDLVLPLKTMWINVVIRVMSSQTKIIQTESTFGGSKTVVFLSYVGLMTREFWAETNVLDDHVPIRLADCWYSPTQTCCLKITFIHVSSTLAPLVPWFLGHCWIHLPTHSWKVLSQTHPCERASQRLQSRSPSFPQRSPWPPGGNDAYSFIFLFQDIPSTCPSWPAIQRPLARMQPPNRNQTHKLTPQ